MYFHYRRALRKGFYCKNAGEGLAAAADGEKVRLETPFKDHICRDPVLSVGDSHVNDQSLCDHANGPRSAVSLNDFPFRGCIHHCRRLIR